MLYDGKPFHVLTYPPLPLLVALLVLVNLFPLIEEPEHSIGLSLVFVEQNFGLDLDLLRLIKGLGDEHAGKFAIERITNNVLDRMADRQTGATHFNGDLDVALVSITVNSLLDGSDDLFDSECKRLRGMVFTLGGTLLLVLTSLLLPPNVHDHGTLKPKAQNGRCRLPSGAKRFCACILS